PSASHPHLHSFPTRRSSDLQQKPPCFFTWTDQPQQSSSTTSTSSSSSSSSSASSSSSTSSSSGLSKWMIEDVPRSGVEFFRARGDRKSTRLNSSHLVISYAV